MVNQSLCQQGRRKIGVEKVEDRWGGDSWVMRFPSKGTVRSFRQVLWCWMLQALRSMFFSLWTSKEFSSYIVLSSSNWIKFGLYFLSSRSYIGRKITFNFIFVRNSINISPCVEPMSRDACFSFWKESQPQQHSVSALLSC